MTSRRTRAIDALQAPRLNNLEAELAALSHARHVEDVPLLLIVPLVATMLGTECLADNGRACATSIRARGSDVGLHHDRNCQGLIVSSTPYQQSSGYRGVLSSDGKGVNT